MNPNFKVQPLRPGDPFPIDMKNATPKVCGCGSKLFIQAFQAFTISALASPTGREMVAQQAVLVCMDCKTQLETKGGVG